MTINEKHLEQKHEKGGEQQVAGTPITKTEDNAHQQRQEIQNAMKAYRFTKGDNPFTIDMGDGGTVVDKRPMHQEHTRPDDQHVGSKDLNKVGSTESLENSSKSQTPGDAANIASGSKGLSDWVQDVVSDVVNDALRPHPKDKHYCKDGLWRDNESQEVVKPPTTGYVPPLGGELAAADQLKYQAYEDSKKNAQTTSPNQARH